MRKTRLLTFSIIVLPMLAVGGAALMYVSGLTRAAMARIPELVRASAAERIDGIVNIGRVEVAGRGGVVVEDLSIYERANPRRPVVRIPRIEIAYSLADIILRKADPAASIKRIDIVRPEVNLERRSDGTWNITNLLKPSPPGRPLRFRGKIRVASGRMVLRDLSPQRPVENTLTDMEADLDLSGMPVARYRISGKGRPGRLGEFAAKGRYDLGSHSFNADLDVLNAGAAYWSTYPWKTGLRILSGTARAHLRLSRAAKGKPLRYSGVVRVRSGSVGFRQVHAPVKDVHGDLYVRNGAVSMHLRGRLGSSPLVLAGNVLELKSPRLVLHLESDRANLREVARLWKSGGYFSKADLPQRGRIDAVIFGSPRTLGVKFALSGPSISYGGITARSVNVKGMYYDRQIAIEGASAGVGGGRIDMAGDISLSDSCEAVFGGRVSGLKLGELSFLRKYRFSGTGDGSFQAVWRPGRLGVDFVTRVESGRLGNLGFEKGSIRAEYANGDLHVKELSARALGGLVAASGELARDGTLDMQVAGSDVNLASVRKLYWSAPTVGRAQFAGRVTGTLRSPVYEGRVEAYRVMVSGIGMERVAGDVRASRRQIDLRELVAYDHSTMLKLAGRISDPLAPSAHMALTVKADSVELDRIAGTAGFPPLVGGTLSADLSVWGRLRDPKARGSLRMEGGSYQGIPLDSADAQIAYAGKALRIERLTARSGEASLTADGGISRDGQINARFDLSRMDMRKFSHLLRPYMSVSGTLSASGKVGGTTSSPHAEIAIDCENPTVNGQRFARLAGRVSADRSAVIASDFALSDAEGEYLISALSYNPASGAAEFSASVRHGNAGKMLALVDSSPLTSRSDHRLHARTFLDRLPRPLAGTVDISISGRIGPREAGIPPELQAEAAVDNLKYGHSTIQTVRLRGSMRGGIARVDKLEVLDGDTNILAEGSIGPSDSLDLRVDAHSLSANALRQWVKFPDNFSGKADVTLVASGSIASPDMDMSVEVVDPVVGGVRFDRLRGRLSSHQIGPLSAGDLEGDDSGRLFINDLVLVLGDRDLRATGYIPVDWRELAVPSDGSMLLQAKLDKDALELVSAFTGLQVETAPGGKFEGLVKLGGTVQSPKLEGQLDWQNGQVRVAKLNGSLAVDGHLDLMGDKLFADKLRVTSSEGGTADISGYVALASFQPRLDLSVKGRDFTLSGHDITGAYGEDVRAIFDGELKVAGDWRSPSVSGRVSIPNGLLAMMGKTSKVGQGGKLQFNPSFDVQVSLGRDVQFKSPRLKSPLYGNLAIKGTLGKPAVDGTVDISDGTIAFPMRQLKILPGSTMSVHLGSSSSPSVFVDMQAQGRLSAMTMTGQRQRYVVNMAAQGPLDKLNPTFTSSPPGLSEQRIVALLTGQRQIELILAQDSDSDIGRGLGGLVYTAVIPSVFEPLTEAFETTLGFDEFVLEMGYREPLQLTIGDRLWDGLHLSYSAILGSRPDYADSLYEVQLSYRFKRGIELGLTTDENKTVTIGIEGKLRF